ncbi:MAG: hypothetical protein EOM54_10360 [Clostridia bacterium]|nr:hypothetical protein [Clostridia bacterium]
MIRTYRSGSVVEESKFWVSDRIRPRGKRKAGSSPRKQDQNDREAVKRLARLINCNFRPEDMWITLTYSDAGFPGLSGMEINEAKARAAHDLTLFLRRMKRAVEKNGGEWRYITVTSDMDGETGEVVRPHHHIIMPRAAYELCKKNWKLGTVDMQTLRHQADYTAIAVYLVRQVRKTPDAKKWNCSRGMNKPEITERIVSRCSPLKNPVGTELVAEGSWGRERGEHYIRYIDKRPKKKRDEGGGG